MYQQLETLLQHFLRVLVIATYLLYDQATASSPKRQDCGKTTQPIFYVKHTHIIDYNLLLYSNTNLL